MPYIGNEVGNRFVASKAASVYSGDGSTTAFTLEHAVGSDEDILVSVDGVIQEPSVAYAVSSGTTLTFTAAPSSNSGNNIFVYYLFRTVATVDHPSTSALSATSGTFSTTLGVTGVTTLGSTLSATKISTGTTDNPNSSPLYIRCATDDNIRIGQETHASIHAVNNAANAFVDLKIDASNLFLNSQSAGFVTMPSQPAFSVKPASKQTNIAVGSTLQITMDSEVFDVNSDYSTSDNAFNAPVTGKYQLNATIMIENFDSAATYYQINLVTSNRTYYHTIDPDFGQDAAYYSVQISALADMDASDVARLNIQQVGGTQQTDVHEVSTFTGCLVC